VPITFSCTCGQSITVPDQFAGKMGRCPNCKNPVYAPMPGAPAATPGAQPRPATQGGQPRPATQGGQPRPASSAANRPTSGTKPARITAKLQVVRADSAPGTIGKSFGLVGGKPNVIGRDPQVDIAIPSDRISRRHCQLEPTPDGVFVLTDLGSSNGTLVNQEKINGRKVLLGGEYIQIGDVLLRFLDQ
jgi:pSer/pThr/pTyr-binding forkhead associated (FHA) protein